MPIIEHLGPLGHSLGVLIGPGQRKSLFAFGFEFARLGSGTEEEVR